MTDLNRPERLQIMLTVEELKALDDSAVWLADAQSSRGGSRTFATGISGGRASAGSYRLEIAGLRCYPHRRWSGELNH